MKVPREEFLRVVCTSSSNAEAARRLGIADATVCTRCQRMRIPTPAQRRRDATRVVALQVPKRVRLVYLLETRRHRSGTWIVWQRLREHRYRKGEIFEANTVAYWDLGEREMSEPEQQLLEPWELHALLATDAVDRHKVVHPEFERQLVRRVLKEAA